MFYLNISRQPLLLLHSKLFLHFTLSLDPLLIDILKDMLNFIELDKLVVPYLLFLFPTRKDESWCDRLRSRWSRSKPAQILHYLIQPFILLLLNHLWLHIFSLRCLASEHVVWVFPFLKFFAAVQEFPSPFTYYPAVDNGCLSSNELCCLFDDIFLFKQLPVVPIPQEYEMKNGNFVNLQSKPTQEHELYSLFSMCLDFDFISD